MDKKNHQKNISFPGSSTEEKMLEGQEKIFDAFCFKNNIVAGT
jgi:hypothetical protein